MAKQEILLGVVVVLVILLAYRRYGRRGRDIESAGASVFGVGRLLTHYGGTEEAGLLLYNANSRVLAVARYLRDQYRIGETDDVVASRGPPADTQARRIAEAILRNYNYEEIYENDPHNSEGSTSFMINKKIMHVCLRHKSNPEVFVPEDVLVFVMLHELSHIGNYNGWAHGADFWSVFGFVLRAAVKCGAYTYAPYHDRPEEYCGITIKYTPIGDEGIAAIAGEL